MRFYCILFEWNLVSSKAHLSSIVAGYCARIYDHPDFEGDSYEIDETNHHIFSSNWIDRVRSVEVSQGCILKLFRDKWPCYVHPLHTISRTISYDFMPSSASCSCKGKTYSGVILGSNWLYLKRKYLQKWNEIPYTTLIRTEIN